LLTLFNVYYSNQQFINFVYYIVNKTYSVNVQRFISILQLFLPGP